MAEVKTQNDLDFERKHEEDLRRIRDFRLMDDNFMSKVFEDKPCAEFQLINICLHRIKKVRFYLHTLTSQQKIH